MSSHASTESISSGTIVSGYRSHSSTISNVHNHNAVSVLDYTRNRIQKFVDENQLAFTGPRASAVLAFPEYIEPHFVSVEPQSPGVTKIPFAVSDKVRIRIFKPISPGKASQKWATEYITLVVSPEDCRRVTRMAVSKCTKGNFTNGSGINTESKSSGRDPNDGERRSMHSERYVLKALGPTLFSCTLSFLLFGINSCRMHSVNQKES